MKVSRNPPELYQTILQLINDPQGRVWTEEQMDVFIDEAGNLIPRLAASLMGMSRGAYEIAYRFVAWPGIPQTALADLDIRELATVFRDIFTMDMPNISPEGRLRMAESQIRAIAKWNLPSESLNRIDALIKET